MSFPVEMSMGRQAATALLREQRNPEGGLLSDAARRDEYVELMTAYQGRMLGYVLSLVGDIESAADIVQEANLILLKRWKEFEPGTDFKAWSFRIAHFQVMANRRRKSCERVEFNDELLSLITLEATRQDEFWLGRAARLGDCIKRLNLTHREMVRMRYVEGLSVRELAGVFGRSVNAISQSLFRVRERLIECVRQAELDGQGEET